MKLAYPEYVENLEKLLKEIRSMLSEMKRADSSEVGQMLEEAFHRLETEAPLRIPLIGEFSAGKSTMISALAGVKLKIDADVATDRISEHEWNGLVLVDTPGIQSRDEETDHDRIARTATVNADLVLFVITSEMFTPRLAEHLRFILDAEGLGLASKTCLVVNKMDRENNPDSEILAGIAPVLENHRDVPVYFCAARKYLEAAEAPEPFRIRFRKQSRIDEFILGLNRFVADAGFAGRLATPLSLAAELLDRLQTETVASSEDRNRLELLRRQKRELHRLQERLAEVRMSCKRRVHSVVMGEANEAVESVADISREKDLADLFESGMKRVAEDIGQVYDGLEISLRAALREATDELEKIGESPLAKELEAIEAGRKETADIRFDGKRPGEACYGVRIARVTAESLREGLEAAARNTSGMRDIVYKVGKTFGKKFRPWEAVRGGEKLAVFAGKAAKGIPVLTAALDFYFQYREEKEKEEKARYLAALRISLRDAFAEQARLEADAVSEAMEKISADFVDAPLGEIAEAESEIAASDSRQENLKRRIADLKKRCAELRNRIRSGPASRAKAE